MKGDRLARGIDSFNNTTQKDKAKYGCGGKIFIYAGTCEDAVFILHVVGVMRGLFPRF